MAKQYIITAIDIGSGFIKLLSVTPKKDGFEILSSHQAESLGVRKGVVVDTGRVSEIISSLVSKAEEDTGTVIDSVYANIGGSHVSSISSKGLVSVSRADRKISKEDIDRVIAAARTFPLSSNNRDVIETIAKEFIVDGESGIRDAIGMEGVRLEAETLLLCGFAPYIKNSSQAITGSGLDINELIPDSLASSKSVLSQREKELGVCVLDIGAGTTNMAVYEEGTLSHSVVFPVGSGHITNDIAICFKTDIDTAEKIKLEYGMCKEEGKKKTKVSADKKIKVEGEEPLEFSQKMLSDIINARVSEIFSLVGSELKKIAKQKDLPAGLVITGGGAKLPGIKDHAKKQLKLPCKIGKPKESIGFAAEPALSTLCGLALEGFEIENDTLTSSKIRKGGIWGKVTGLFRSLIP